MASYNHIELPHIEKYANQLEWKEGTIEEAMTKEELAQRAIKNIKKLADLEHFTQVFSLPSTQVGAAASSSAAPQKVAQTTTQAVSSARDKGKEHEQPPFEEHQEKQQEDQLE